MKRIALFLIFCLWLSFILIGIIHAFPQDLEFEYITTEDGLSSNTVYHILQDKRGFIWFGTSDGLCRYAGHTIKEYKHNPDVPYSISSSWCSELFEDRAGNIWIGTHAGGLNQFDPITERFIHFKHTFDDSNKIIDDNVLGICEDSSGAFWIGTSNGLDKLVIRNDPLTDDRTYQFTHYQHEYKNINTLSDNQIWHLYLDDSNVLWISTGNGGLDRFDIATETFAHFRHDPADPHSISSNKVRYVYEDPIYDGNVLWIGTHGGLNKLNKTTKKFTRFLHDPDNNHSLSHNIALTIQRDMNGVLWIGTRSGLNILDESNGVFYHYKYNPTDINSLSNDFIYSMCEDRNGSLWFGTINGGVNKLVSMRKEFNLYKNRLREAECDGVLDIRAIYEDNDGLLWIGTECGLNRYDRDSGKLLHFQHEPDNHNSLIYDKVYSIYEDTTYTTKTLWIGCYGGGLDRLTIRRAKYSDDEITRFEHFTHDPYNPQSISSNFVDKIFKDKSGRLWIATYDGLNYFDPVQETFIRYRYDPNDPYSISHNRVTVIHQSPHDSSHILWIGTECGLNKFYTDKNMFIHYLHDPADSNSLSHNYIYSLYANADDKRHRLWIGTFGGGLNEFDIDREKFTRFDTDDGLNSNAIACILEDDNGVLWLSTIKGISCFDLQSMTFRNYATDDGILEGIYYPMTGFKNSRGEIFFGGGQGLISFYPDSIKVNSLVPPIMITDFKVFDKPIELSQSITLIEQINLTYKQDYFSFEFSALDYVNPKKNQYAYKLEGLQNDWNYCSNRRIAYYNNISPGEYRFRVKGSNNDGIWNEEGTSVKIIITPPFWMASWFKVAIGIIFMTGLIAFYKMRVSILKKEKRIQQSISSRLIEELEKARKRMAGELHDGLGQNLMIIKNEIQHIISKSSSQKNSNGELDEVSSLISESINEVREIAADLHPHQLDRLGLKKAIESIIYKCIHSSDIDFIIEIDEIDDLFPKNLEIHIFRIIQEGLTNIVKHANASIVKILFKTKQNRAYITISDNGIGFDFRSYQSGRTYNQGFGLAGMVERVKILRGKLDIDSDHKKGTTINVQIPINESSRFI